MKQLVIEDINTLPETLRVERIRQNKSRKQISIRSKVSVNMILSVEHEHSVPGINTLKNWARALGYNEIVIKC